MLRQRRRGSQSLAASSSQEGSGTRSVRNGGSSADKQDVSDDERTCCRCSLIPSRSWCCTAAKIGMYYSIHAASVLFLVAGVLASFRLLYTAEECDMTWSQREFLPIEDIKLSPSSHNPTKYRLFKFRDKRDPRYNTPESTAKNQQQQQQKSSSAEAYYCMPNVTTVLYVPGHGGSYEQSRSLGAHGTQLTRKYGGNLHEKRVLQKLRQLNHRNTTTTAGSSASTTDDNDFFYDVYAVDFGEEGGGFHGALLHRQAAFLAHVVHALATACALPQQGSKIVIVAHSIGGVSVRLAQLDHPHLVNGTVVSALVTLGTPHARSVLTWERGVLNVYQRLAAFDHSSRGETVQLVSISGGLRDEMVPPKACHVRERGQTTGRVVSLLSTELMQAGSVEAKDTSPTLGMDHRAIVWCHNLLSQVRQIIYTLQAGKQVDYTNDNAASSSDYLTDVSNLRTILQTNFGRVGGLALETGLLYNAELLVQLYACIGAFRYLIVAPPGAGGLAKEMALLWALPFGVAVLQYSLLRPPALSFPSVAALVFAADSIFLSVRGLLCRFLEGRWAGEAKPNGSVWVFRILMVFLVGWTAARALLGPETVWLQAQAVTTMVSLVVVYALSLALVASLPPRTTMPQVPNQESDHDVVAWYRQQTSFVVWLLLLIPFISFGDVVVIPEGLTSWTVPLLIGPQIVRLQLALCTLSLPASTLARARGTTSPELCLLRASVLASPVIFECWKLLAIDIYEGTPHALFGLHPLSTLMLSAAVANSLKLISVLIKCR